MDEPQYEHLVFAGNGMSAVACVEELLKTGQAFDITIFGDEPHTNYDRALLPRVLAGERDFDSIVLNDIEWYQEHGIRTRLGIRVEEIDRLGRAVRSSDGDWTSYDKLILATGSTPLVPSADGLDKAGVFFFGTLDDTRGIIDAASEGTRAVVIGGWLAAEAGRGLRKRGCDVTVVDMHASVFERGIDAVLGDGRVEGVRFTDGEVVRADLVVIALGFQPNIQLAMDAGLKVDRGIVVNDQMETSDPHIFALGGCAQCNEEEQAKVLAANLSADRLSTIALSRR
jgi:nitrite reductase (NADH) large subunit